MKLILGSTPLALSIEEKWRKYDVQRYDEDNFPDSLEGCDEFFVDLGCTRDDAFLSDSRNFAKVLPLLETFSPEHCDGRKLLCHMLFYSQTVCDSFRINNLGGSLNGKIELWPFTMEDTSVRKIVFDREPIPLESESRVHLVIFGMTAWTEALAKFAMLVCHYPNYSRNHNLRTRITVIDDDIVPKSEAFVATYRCLFENSYIRFVDVRGERCKMVRPTYAKTREDFVDIEWEFVQGTPNNDVFDDKLKTWADDENRQLTVALCYENDERNLSLAFRVTDSLRESSIPVYVRVQEPSILCSVNLPGNILPLCSDVDSYDVTLPERRMAQIVNHVYSQAYSESPDSVQVPSDIDVEAAAVSWEKIADADLRWASVCNALSIRSKMHSLGHDESDWDTFYSVSAREIAALAEVEHNRWSVAKLMMGYRPLTDAKQKEISQDINMKKIFKSGKFHYDLRSYRELGSDETGKSAQIYDIRLSEAIPLMSSVLKKSLEGK